MPFGHFSIRMVRQLRLVSSELLIPIQFKLVRVTFTMESKNAYVPIDGRFGL